MEKSDCPYVFLLPKNSSFELNFKTYYFEEESAIFIPIGQYFNADPTSHRIRLDKEDPLHYRYLFSQVITLGHVNADSKIKSISTKEVLDYSSQKWMALNPFNTKEDELELLFDANDWLENNIEAQLDVNSFLSFKDVQRLSKKSLKLTVFQWKNHKLINRVV